ncbi:MAG: cobalamin-dependent protein, partial [Desulfofustis sp.]
MDAKKMRVLLISANTEQFNMPAMPLGLACVAEATKLAGHDVTMLDLMFQKDVSTTLEAKISELQPECIGISVRNIDDQHIENTQFLIEKVKPVVTVCRSFSTSPIVLGGAGYSMFPESALVYLDADFGIAGEGEIAFRDLLTHLQNDKDPSTIPGLIIKGAGPPKPKILCNNLDKLPLPDPGILSDSAAQSHEPWIPVQTRRGCALTCSYCSTSTIEGPMLRKRSPEIVSEWLESWVRVGYENFFFVDNTFNLPPAYAKSLCQSILERNLQMSWRCIIYPNKVDRELADLMSAAG